MLKRSILILTVGLMAALLAPAGTLTGPGTPCTDIFNEDFPCSASVPTATAVGNDPLFVLAGDPGVVHLPVFVVPGDVVLFETPNGTLGDTSTWSDVVEFANVPGVRGSFATTFPDAEGFGVILPPGFVLSLNAVGLPENPVGNGTDADFTTYIAGSATYQIHSDSPAHEQPEPMEGVPEPSTMGLLGLGLSGVLLLGKLRAR